VAKCFVKEKCPFCKKKRHFFGRSGKQLSGQFGNPLTPALALLSNSFIRFADGYRSVMVASWIALNYTTCDKHGFEDAHDCGFVTTGNIC
jgi:hypothetical protein